MGAEVEVVRGGGEDEEGGVALEGEGFKDGGGAWFSSVVVRLRCAM